jgi:hypothetical protein
MPHTQFKHIFPAKFVFDGEPKELETNEYVVLDHNCHVYVHVPFAAENIGSIDKYEDETKTMLIEDTNLSEKLKLDNEFLTFAFEGKIEEEPHYWQTTLRR